MPFDMGWNFRATAGYVTDPSYGVPVLAEAYPHTYTNANGYSVNAGWNLSISSVDRASGNDPRLAGINYTPTSAGGVRAFTADLSSGSAPGAGDYLVDLAVGDTDGHPTTTFALYDDTTLLIDGTNGGAGTATAGGHYLDATVTDIAASTSWTGTAVAKSFATTVAKVTLPWVSDAACIAHFRLTLEAPAGGGAGGHVFHHHHTGR